MPAEFDTREYESNHGAKPRGFGLWAFALVQAWPDVAPKGEAMENLYWVRPSCTYSQAKRQVARELRARYHSIKDVIFKVMS
jgi:hypothetical protein